MTQKLTQNLSGAFSEANEVIKSSEILLMSYCAPATLIICLFTSDSMVYLSTVRISLSLPGECHRSESGCIGPSAPWRCEPSG